MRWVFVEPDIAPLTNHQECASAIGEQSTMKSVRPKPFVIAS